MNSRTCYYAMYNDTSTFVYSLSTQFFSSLSYIHILQLCYAFFVICLMCKFSKESYHVVTVRILKPVIFSIHWPI